MSLPDLLTTLAETQRAVVAALGVQYFCDDLEPPPAAFGWGEQQLRLYFESGGERVPANASPARSGSADERRPVIVCLGDSLTEFGSHVVGPKFADATLKSAPAASEVLSATDGCAEHGPGWVSLLARDYQWRMTADVVNRGASGMTSRLLKADLATVVSSLPVGGPRTSSIPPPHHHRRASAERPDPSPRAAGRFSGGCRRRGPNARC